jgi:hypothetical protein
MKQFVLTAFLLFAIISVHSQVGSLRTTSQKTSNSFPLVANGKATTVWVDTADYVVAQIAAGLFSEDIQRITDVRPEVSNRYGFQSDQAIIIGTIGKSALI